MSKLLERISALEAMVNAQDKEIKRVDDSIQDVETNLSIWSEKEFSKVYEILNDNPLGR
mgnify:FL=1